MFKMLDEYDVKEVFEELLSENGQVTSKDVKEKLREKGFWAIQAQISWFIKQNYKNWGSKVNYNGMYNVYVSDTEEDYIPLPNNIALISIDEDDNDDNVVQSKKCACQITYIQRITDDEKHITVYSPKIGNTFTAIVNKYDFDDAQYIMSYNGDAFCYVGSKDIKLANKQARYYAWRIFKEDFPDMEYFDVRCRKIE